MAKLCLWETLLGFMDETTARLMEKFRNFLQRYTNVTNVRLFQKYLAQIMDINLTFYVINLSGGE